LLKIEDLDLEKQLLVTPLDSVAASNRFVYYPDHLVRMPGPGGELYSDLWKLFTEPVFAGWAASLLEFNRPRRATWSQYQNPDVDDESVGSFLERRTGGPNIGNNLVSAVLHGIYAGDINQLSARSLMPQVWWAESFFGSYTMAALQRLSGKARMQPYNDVMLQEELRPKISQHLNTLMANASVYTFKQGIGTLVNALEKSLRANQNVDFKVEHEVKSLHSDAQTSDISVSSPFCTMSLVPG
jgi:oxygen-dependent protoporphyrinogen oxidase